MSFDVQDRSLMGFMGSLDKDNNLVQLGPLLSRKIVAQEFKNMEISEPEDPAGGVNTIIRNVCNDDSSVNRTITVTFK